MRELKKSPRQQLEKFSTIFMQLGLVLVLFVVFVSLEHETEETAMVMETKGEEIIEMTDFDIPIIYTKEVVRKIEPKVERVITKLIDKPEVVKNDEEIKKSIITEPVVEEPVVVKIIETKEEEIIDEEDDPTFGLPFVSKIPVFAGCENLSKTESRKCFDKKMNRLVKRYFNTDLANELGLKSGKNKILTQFVIDKEGKVTDVKIRAPHARLKKETQRIINKIPVFTPGEKNGKTVNVRYTLPINFQVE